LPPADARLRLEAARKDAAKEEAALAEKMTHALAAVGKRVFGDQEDEDSEEEDADAWAAENGNGQEEEEEECYREEPRPSSEGAALLASAALQSTGRTAGAALLRAEAATFDAGTAHVAAARRAALATAAVAAAKEGRYGSLAALEPEPKPRVWLPKKQVRPRLLLRRPCLRVAFLHAGLLLCSPSPCVFLPPALSRSLSPVASRWTLGGRRSRKRVGFARRTFTFPTTVSKCPSSPSRSKPLPSPTPRAKTS
jgi:hypothetical protein